MNASRKSLIARGIVKPHPLTIPTKPTVDPQAARARQMELYGRKAAKALAVLGGRA